MDARLEAALLDVLERMSGGAPVDDAWLRAAHPQQWREIRALLDFQARLAGGAPGGARVGPYRLLQRLGRGGTGTVFLATRLPAETESASCHRAAAGSPRIAEIGTDGLAARDDDGGEPDGNVALKLVHAHLAERPGFVERTLAEARAAAALSHPNVVRTLDAGVADGPNGPLLYVVTEHVEGQNLRGLLDELGPLGEPLVRHLAREILAALAAVHAAGVVHGDLKPENVLIGPDESVKVADLGVASASDAASPGGGEGVPFRGTILYAAPEQIGPRRGAVDGRADLFALGVMLEELLAGSHPLTPSRPLRAAVPPSAFLRAFAATLRRERPDDRFADAAAALAVLDAGEGSPWWASQDAGMRDAPAAHAGWAAAAACATTLHGRTRELARLRDLLGEAAAGEGRTVLVEGAAGAGKTRLLEELAREATAAGARVVWCAHDDAAGASPIAAGLRASFAADGTDPAAHAASVEAVGAALVAWIRDMPPGGVAAPVPSPARAVAVGEMLRSMAADRPVLLVADDVHLAADEERSLLAEVAAALCDARVLVIAAARTRGGDGPCGGLAAAPRITLDDLSVEAVHGMVAEALRSDALADRLAPEAHRCTGGNPLAVLEHLDALRAADVLVPDGNGAWTLRDVPAAEAGTRSARALLSDRFGALRRADRELLACAACAGPRFDPALVARALGRDPGRVLLRLARLERREHLVRPAGDEIAFAHHEVRDAILDTVPEEDLRVHHRALGAALEAACAGRGGPPPRERVVIARHFLRAGDGVRAAPHVGPALAWIESADRASDVVDLAAAALATPGAVGPAGRSAVLLLRGRRLAAATRYDEAAATFEEAIRDAEACADAHGARAARAARVRCLQETGRFDEALALGRSLLAEALAAGDADAESEAHGALGAVLSTLHRDQDARVHLLRSAELTQDAGDPVRAAAAQDELAAAAFGIGDLAATYRHVSACVAILRGAGAAPSLLAEAVGDLGYALTRLGRREEALAALAESARLAQATGLVRREETSRIELGRQLRFLGRAAEAQAQLERALLLTRRSGDRLAEQGVLRELGHQAAGQGRTADALALHERALRVAEECGYAVGVIQSHATCADVRGRIGDFARARAHAVAAADAAAGSGSTQGAAVAALALARWGSGDGRHDAAGLGAAADAFAAHGVHEMAAAVRFDLARIALAEGRPDDAAAALEAAIATQSAAGWLVFVGEAHLAALGRRDASDLARRLAAGWAALTVWARIEIAGLVARVAGDTSFLARARDDVEAAVAGAPAEFRDRLRARLTSQLA